MSATTAAATANSGVKEILDQISQLPLPDLVKVMKAAAAQFEKAAKPPRGRVAKKTSTKKPSDPNRGKQLVKPRAWVKYVHQHALTNGWKEFTVSHTKTDKITGLKTTEDIVMPESECIDGVYYYKDTVDPKTGKPKTMIHKDAMSLSKIYWSAKDKTGRHPELYQDFETNYVPPADVSDVSDVSDASDASEHESEAEPEVPAPAPVQPIEKPADKPAKKSVVTKKKAN